MNRQFRRAQEKQDKKQEKEKARRREERKSRLRQLRRGRKEKASSDSASVGSASDKTSSKESAPARRGRGRDPGRFSGFFAAVTVFFISLLGASPGEEIPTIGDSLASAAFYLILGHFATLWFLRRGVARAPLVTIIGGTLLAGSVTLMAVLQEGRPDLLALALSLPLLVLGTLLGNLVFRASHR